MFCQDTESHLGHAGKHDVSMRVSFEYIDPGLTVFRGLPVIVPISAWSLTFHSCCQSDCVSLFPVALYNSPVSLPSTPGSPHLVGQRRVLPVIQVGTPGALCSPRRLPETSPSSGIGRKVASAQQLMLTFTCGSFVASLDSREKRTGLEMLPYPGRLFTQNLLNQLRSL